MRRSLRFVLALPLILIGAPVIATDTGFGSAGSGGSGVGSDRDNIRGGEDTTGDRSGTTEEPGRGTGTPGDRDRKGNALPNDQGDSGRTGSGSSRSGPGGVSSGSGSSGPSSPSSGTGGSGPGSSGGSSSSGSGGTR